MKDEYRLDKQAFDRKHPGVSEGWRKEVKINKARKKQRKLEEEGRSYKMVVFTREGVSLVFLLLLFFFVGLDLEVARSSSSLF